MIIEFQLTGEKRKELVNTVSEIIGIPAEYQFMPTCAYKIGDFYTVTKEGNLEISDSADSKETEHLMEELKKRGYDVPDTTEPESTKLTVQMPADFFTEHTLSNLRQICENKATLFKAAFQTDSLDIIPSDEKVEFPWFKVEQDGDADACCTFISMLCEFAKNQSRINRKPDTSDNPKYTMRCFLIRLGMVGAEFKTARKVILRNLTGNSAFRKVGDLDEVSE
ncbi:virulence protein [uncultured Ruminococcus sp.]|uniref:virulence protein n=1 Tax=uncultured Ruminococcus sp. TaxID=165186 RepID=UPI00266F1CFD|nr:virulence protein [uncultured Ruminococcus sp.]